MLDVQLKSQACRVKIISCISRCSGEVFLACSLVFRGRRNCPGSQPGREGWEKQKKAASWWDSWGQERGETEVAVHWCSEQGESGEAEVNDWWGTGWDLLLNSPLVVRSVLTEISLKWGFTTPKSDHSRLAQSQAWTPCQQQKQWVEGSSLGTVTTALTFQNKGFLMKFCSMYLKSPESDRSWLLWMCWVKPPAALRQCFCASLPVCCPSTQLKRSVDAMWSCSAVSNSLFLRSASWQGNCLALWQQNPSAGSSQVSSPPSLPSCLHRLKQFLIFLLLYSVLLVFLLEKWRNKEMRWFYRSPRLLQNSLWAFSDLLCHSKSPW